MTHIAIINGAANKSNQTGKGRLLFTSDSGFPILVSFLLCQAIRFHLRR